MSYNGRQKANREILAILEKIIEEQPDLRFGQVLRAIGIKTEIFYEESTVTLHKAELSEND